MLITFCVSLWQYKTFKNNKLEVMCKSSISDALEHFKEYETNRKDADYIAGVAEFRTYMTAYLCLKDVAGNTDYIWCNILYGDMILNPEKIKEHIDELVEALECFSDDYDNPNGFNLINAFNNQLSAE